MASGEIEEKIQDVQEKVKKERMVLDGAIKMLAAQTVPAAKQLVENSIAESRQRIEFLEGELRKLSLKRLSQVSKDASQEGRPSNLIKFDNSITSEKVKYRLGEISMKLEIESRVKAGTENMISAMTKTGDADAKRRMELEAQISVSKTKEVLLQQAKKRYNQLYVASDEEEEDALVLNDTSGRQTGRLRLRILDAINVTGRKSIRDEIVAQVSIDGSFKYQSKPSLGKFNDLVDIQVDKGLEVEIRICERGGQILSLIWFKLKDLIDDLNAKIGKERTITQEVGDTWFDLEPSGQLNIRANFIPVSRAMTAKDQVFRRDAVQKIYPRNGHRYVARQFFQVMQCTICSEFLGRQGYQCTSCNNTVHPRCYQRVITKCIPPEDMANAADKNTGQLLKYKIPHRWDTITNLGASWCSHCGYILPLGKKVNRCSECSKSAHKECSIMVPCFCGLDPNMADTLIAAFEAHEQKMLQKEIEDAEQSRKQTPVFEQADMNHLESALNAKSPMSATPEIPPTTASQGMRLSQTQPVAIPDQMQYPNRTDSLPPAQGRPSSGQAPRLSNTGRVSQAAAPQPPQISKDVTIDDFHFIAVLGRGAFGKVMLASEKTTGNLYAIKALKKEFIIQNDDVKSVKLEKSIFQAASANHHPFLVNLHSSFDTPGRLYFVMEYVSGGDLMCHIQDKKRFHQGRARFYACEVLTALQYFHQNNIVYRDLKLDNILLCADGHIKVADYGICKAGMPYGTTTATFCGTPDYMAPEILMNRKYGVSVDWWSFGVLIYVMLVGRYPFHGDDENDILEAILADTCEFPSNLPKVTLNLLQSLMHKNPARRLGAGREDAEEVKRHPYFTGIDWEALLQKNCTPPFVPIIQNARDVSNFDKEFTSEAPVLTPINSVLNEVDQKEFNDFGYISDWAYQSRIAAALSK